MIVSKSDYSQKEITKLLNISQVSISWNLSKIKEKIFPYFKMYLEGEIRYGKLCFYLLREKTNAP